MATRKTNTKATGKASSKSSSKTQISQRRKAPAKKISPQKIEKVTQKSAGNLEKKPPDKPTARPNLRPNPLKVAPTMTTFTVSESDSELRSEMAELRGQLQALVANLSGRQPMLHAQPQVVMLQPLGLAMGSTDDWQARHDLTHERDELRNKIQAKESTIAQLQQEVTELKDAVQAHAQARQILSDAQEVEIQARQSASAERDIQTNLANLRAVTILQLQQEVADLNAAVQAEAQARQALSEAHQSEVQARQSACIERDNLLQRVQHLEALQKDSKEEAELLLKQLHQVQEELEHYYLDTQALKQDKEQLQQRVTRLLKRLPGTVEWEDLTVQATKARLTLTLQQIMSVDRQVPYLKLILARQKKQPTLQVISDQGQPVALLHGPLSQPINPLVIANSAEASALDQLAPSDIRLLQKVCTSVAPSLPATMAGRDKWAADLNLLADQLKGLPPVWRYDAVSLRQQQVDPYYEHLWFHFDNATFGQRHWPSFEFRLGAANIRKGKFSQYPKLEFPDPGPGLPKQFENWFEESEDDYGVKFELRFDLRKTAMDMAVWETLSPDDQAQMLSLLDLLSIAMRRLEDNGTSTQRPWTEWHELLHKVRFVISKNLELPFLN